jgi:pSer/pThr/pTyr-binding forkhead associated (FHA) protein
MGQVFFRAIACGLAGLFAWLVTEPFADRFIPLDPSKQQQGSGQMWLIILIGSLVGLTAGALQGMARGSRRHAIEMGLLGLVFGAIGSTFGAQIGAAISTVVMQVPAGGVAYMDMPGRMIARALALFPIGLFMGLAIGLTLKSKRGVMAGLMGGLVGGLFVGFAFDTLAGMIGNLSANVQSGVEIPEGYMLEIGGPSRAVLAVGLGVAVGLFVALIDRVTRQAWVRLVLGRNEGKEWPIDNEQTLIGRDERAHIPLMGDMNVAPLHAIIFKQGSQYVVQDQGTAIGVGWNGQRVPTAHLSPGDTFQVGSHNLQFLMKDSAARAMHEGRAHGMPQFPPMQQPLNPIQQPYQAPGMQTYVQPQQTQTFPSGAAGAAPFPVLVVTSGPFTGQRFDLSMPLEAGREGTGISLSFDSQASRKHALFSPTPGGVQVQDLGSTNGTFVNGNRVQSAQLNRGDVVTIGNSAFRVE